MTVSLPQVRQVLQHSKLASQLLHKVLPRMEQATTRLDDLERMFVADGTAIYQDAANARREVTAALHRGQRALGKTPSLATAEFGPASPAVTAARRADSDINLAISHLNEAFVPYVEPFGGVHTQVNLTRLNEARALIARTTGAVETTVRRAVNAG